MIECVTLSSAEAAKYLGISYWLMLELVKRGDIHPIKIGKKGKFFRQTALDEWMSKQEEGGSDKAILVKKESLRLIKAK